MDTSRNDVLLTSAQVDEWKRMRADLQKRIEDAQHELALVSKWLDAVAVLPGGNAISTEVKGGLTQKSGLTQEPQAGETMIDAIERIVKESATPLAKPVVKEMLEAQGFDRSRLGNYFYTVVSRLKERRKIMILEDGRLATLNNSPPVF